MPIRDLGARSDLAMPALTFRAAIRADIGPPVEFATTQGTTRAVFPITGGAILGDGLSGRILPGGADFARLLPDGSYAIEARYCIAFDDGPTVMITNAGRMYLQPDGAFLGRTCARFETPPGRYAWLGDAVFLGTALAEPGDDEHVFIELWQATL